jgi:integrase/recombinase XerD
LSTNHHEWLDSLLQTLIVGNYGAGTIRNYLQEMRLLFQFYEGQAVETFTQKHLNQYIFYIKTHHGVGHSKCKMVASACCFFFKHVMEKPFVLPSKLFPRKVWKLPAVMAQTEVNTLLESNLDSRERVLIGLLYGCGLRLSEARNLTLADIDRAHNRLNIRQAKGHKDRFGLLPKQLLTDLETYWRAYRMKKYVFESPMLQGRPLHGRSLQCMVNAAMVKAGFSSGTYTAHTLRHSFATHLLDAGQDIHTIKTLLGHAKIETTMIYLHLQQSRRDILVSPLDLLVNQP